jgi:FkbM family methyltransferase
MNGFQGIFPWWGGQGGNAPLAFTCRNLAERKGNEYAGQAASSAANSRLDGSPMQEDLVYDIGLHRGEDTQFYLAKGFRVVAVEGNPALVAHCRQVFADAIDAGRLQIIEGAIAPAEAGDTIRFYVNPKMSIWGTISPEYEQANAQLGKDSQSIEVPRVDIADLLQRRGMPFFMKIDIEGADTLVIDALRQLPDRPRFLSTEASAVDVASSKNDLYALKDLGYRRFQIVQQATIPGSRLNSVNRDGNTFDYVFPDHASGPFGDELPGRWHDFSDTIAAFGTLTTRKKMYGPRSRLATMRGGWRLRRLIESVAGPVGWHDIHARLD